MPTLQSIFKDAKSLSDREIQELFNNLGVLISLKAMTKSIHSDSREQRYPGGVACLHCGSTSVIKHGKKNGVHRFKWLQTIADEKETSKAKHLLANSSTKLTDTRIRQYTTREPIYN